MNKKLGINTPKDGEVQKVYIRPSWVKNVEEELCPDCFKVVGDKNRYTLVCMLGKTKEGLTVGELTKRIKLRQPTVTHHLNILRSVDAVTSEDRGRERVYRLNRDAHCFEECKIPY
ncbi:MAG: winged helix-turn-helix transcriptional regulator [Candidatus Levybacteria bacterium]|jgi:predicted transcriptional regulator|nr:winged helix-turn-helix transcriptional regulator [Candidatus Levybacteria bacterium]